METWEAVACDKVVCLQTSRSRRMTEIDPQQPSGNTKRGLSFSLQKLTYGKPPRTF